MRRTAVTLALILVACTEDGVGLSSDGGMGRDGAADAAAAPVDAGEVDAGAEVDSGIPPSPVSWLLDVLDFGELSRTCPQTRNFALVNHTDASVVVELRVRPASARTLFIADLPSTVELEPNGGQVFDLTYGGPTPSVLDASVVAHVVGYAEAEMLLRGQVSTNLPQERQTWSLPYSMRASYLIVIDAHPTLAGDYLAIRGRVQELLRALHERTLDYRVGITAPGFGGRLLPFGSVDTLTTDDGPAPDLEAIFAEIAAGSPQRRLAQTIMDTLEPAGPGSDTQGLVEPGRDLRVIVVTNGDDESDERARLALHEARTRLPGQGSPLIVTAFAGGAEGCDTNGRSAAPSPQLAGVVDELSSWCADWSWYITLPTGPRSRFLLNRVPVDGTLEVYLNETSPLLQGEWRMLRDGLEAHIDLVERGLMTRMDHLSAEYRFTCR